MAVMEIQSYPSLMECLSEKCELDIVKNVGQSFASAGFIDWVFSVWREGRERFVCDAITYRYL